MRHLAGKPGIVVYWNIVPKVLQTPKVADAV
jgi:hypothetical protein